MSKKKAVSTGPDLSEMKSIAINGKTRIFVRKDATLEEIEEIKSKYDPIGTFRKSYIKNPQK